MFKSIVVPLDGSGYSEQSLATALELARLSGARVTLVTVILGYKDAHVPVVPRLEDQTRKRAEGYLDGFLREGQAAGFEIAARVGHGDPAEEILRLAEESGGDLIVMSTHGIGAGGRHALGSVALKVLQAAQCPVLMVRIPEA
jgi:nucleotide-binding universal stress UspA family protein